MARTYLDCRLCIWIKNLPKYANAYVFEIFILLLFKYLVFQILDPNFYKHFNCMYKELPRQINLILNHTTQNSQNKWTKISDLETNIFELKVGVKSGIEFFILKFYQPLQRYLLTCQANSALLGRSFCTGQQQL